MSLSPFSPSESTVAVVNLRGWKQWATSSLKGRKTFLFSSFRGPRLADICVISSPGREMGTLGGHRLRKVRIFDATHSCYKNSVTNTY